MHTSIITPHLLKAGTLASALKRQNINCMTLSPASLVFDWLPETDAFLFPQLLKKEDWKKILPALVNLNPVTPLIFFSKQQKTVFQKNANPYLKQSIFLDETIPFTQMLLIIKDLIKKNETHKNEIQLGDIRIDRINRVINKKNSTILLSRKEFFLLELLILNAGRITTRESIIDYVWDKREYISQNTIDVYISRLRKKIKPFGKKNFIRTVPCLGYTFELLS